MAQAAPAPVRQRPQWNGDVLTYSASYTVDVTYRCAKRCGYCEYRSDTGGLIGWDVIDAQLAEAARLGGREVLIMSGEQVWLLPDLELPSEAAFVDRVIEICRRAMELGLLPHVNVGLLTHESLERLKPWSPSMGLMLETGTDDLRAHANGGGKRVADRLRHIEDAGRLRIPFTTGILVGIGETRADRERALQLIADSHARHGHVQEVIVQNFVAKPGTPMRDLPGATLADMEDAVRMARAILPASITVQVPPNLLLDGWTSLVEAGARDLGGVSANGDSVSPSLPWESVTAMRERAASIGYVLRERLPVYPDVAADLQPAADELRRTLVGDEVTYVVCRNVNISNVCVGSCSFCGFMRKTHEARGAWHHDHATVFAKIEDAVARGATEICMQSGLQPSLDLDYYDDLFTRIKDRWPSLHLHALSPEEMRYIAEVSGRSISYCIEKLRDAGLGTMPGTAAEILVDEVRAVICPEKLNTEQWVEVMRAAHRAGVRSTSTVMFGHVENWDHRIEHMRVIRDLQRETGGFTEFVLLPFQVERNALGRHYGIRQSPSFDEVLRYTAIARLYFGADIPNIQSSWVKLGADGVAETLRWGANDFGGTLMEESISRASGADHGQNLEALEIEHWIREAGRTPRERTTTYGVVTERPRDRERPLRAIPSGR
ncbi:MAG TPA: 5-amino-6-(D-ribitylamino)uracil--L-tyrosine 4-hydroxyphenyl transferase CofH [Candidatus Angelobacter sp.]|jgi:7,8-didemethyl-8-hydroxy-5-deazariboflavin synthase CofH subunit/7,8-didemethyl-8-hydroxy-5-deazariboflavin synthase CofG subunit|nr:5-amino-6-(D-ribitylamino)uracil--L-tyrosine 4-hydroxyphenyl transferase CofH [Candidatus Angelobacter sp.]